MHIYIYIYISHTTIYKITSNYIQQPLYAQKSSNGKECVVLFKAGLSHAISNDSLSNSLKAGTRAFSANYLEVVNIRFVFG